MCRYAVLLALIFALPLRADDATNALAKELRAYATAELAKVPGKDGKYSTALPDYLRDQIRRANQRDREAWNAVKTRAEWEKFRDERIKALRDSLGTWPEVPKSVPVRVTKTIEAGDYAIENLLYESRPDVWVTGNLYRPTAERERMPVFLIVHSHHAPKHQGELQDMGVTWAKLGCMVLVIDQLGHGERRQHPFADAKDYPKDFRVGRQDYYFRYNLNLQLSLVGDSLMGWMVWDLMRGLDVVLARPGADKARVILLGAVAGGGDPAAVTAALDPRIQCVVPFNFGGPQPETRYPLPEDAETSFNYAGSGSWESTRNLRDSAAKGFLPWVIVSSVAPRKVIHAHEFSWDRDRDPVWKRYQKVWGFYDATDNLSFTHGTGVIQGNDPTASHCTNIGPIHRKGIYAALKNWFDIPVPETEAKERRSADDLRCWTPAAEKELKPKPLHEALAVMAAKQLEQMRIGEAKVPADSRTNLLLNRLRVPFTHDNDRADFAGGTLKTQVQIASGCDITWASFDAGPGSTFRGLVLRPVQKADKQLLPGVICVCQDGGYQFLREHATAVAVLVQAGVGVIMPEVSGTGLQQPGGGHGRTSYATSLSATAQMLGKPLLGMRFDDLITLWKASVRDVGVDPEQVALWGDSLAAPNSDLRSIAVPYDLEQPHLARPLGATLASLLPLGKADVKAVVARGGLVSYRSVLDSPFVHVPHDAVPIRVFRAGDLPDIWAHLAPKPLRLERLVDGTNRRVTGERLAKTLEPVTEAYKKGGLVVKEDYTPDAELAKWIVEQLKK
jgi:cephalosporin-C deacetylase-like acetyl esterase